MKALTLRRFASWRNFPPLQVRRQFSVKTAAQFKKDAGPRNSYSVLDSGLRIATHQPVYGPFCTIGVAISAGSRHEVYYPPGTAHFIEKLAFSSSQNFSDKSGTMELLERCGALVDCQSSRDTTMYASSCRTANAHDVLQVIADTVFRPNILEEEVEICRDVIRYENETLARQPECEPLLTDWIHQAAFRANTLGLSRYSPTESADKVTDSHILSFLGQYYTPSRIVLAGVGVDQEWLEEAGRELFDPSKTTWSNSPERLLPHISQLEVDNSLAQYTGGEIRIERDLSQMALGPTPFPNLAHLVVGFQGVSVSHPDFIPSCVLQSLMGGGGSFSAGGPGKGMFTRLYVEVLNRHGWIHNATAYNHSYADNGLFCIRASSEPSQLEELAAIIVSQFHQLCKGAVTKEELKRAKVQLHSQLLMQLEMRPVQFEDLARQVLAHGKRKSAEEYAKEIDLVNHDDIVRMAHQMLQSPPSLVGYGDLNRMPSYEQLQAMI